MKPKTYTVVENAGYEGERVVREGIKHLAEALAWMTNKYSDDEIEALHVLVRKEYADGTSEY
jgi:hypothetical protein